MSTLYSLLHFIHLTFAAWWAGTALSGDYLLWTLDKSENCLERAKTIRKLLVVVEMPLAVLVPLLGFVLSGIQTAVWREGWLHTKVTLLVLLWILMGLGSKRTRLLVEALEAGDEAGTAQHRAVYRTLRLIVLLAFLGIFLAVVFRFGSGGIEMSE